VLQRDVVFRHGNLLDRDWLYDQGRFAVIFCRNVLIYFEEQALQHAIATLYELLLPGGILFLSSTESLLARKHSFEVIQQDRMLCYRRPR
jgi:chemotaxis protein methyltransferase CheR